MSAQTVDSSPPMESTLLAPEAAIAARICRNPGVERELLHWLSSPAKAVSPQGDRIAASPIESSLVKSFSEIIAPMLASASVLEQKQSKNAPEYLAVIYRTITDECASQQIDAGQRMLVACLLPLYRCLASGDLRGGLEQTRHRIFETITVLALCREFRPDLVELLELAQHSDESPHSTIGKQIGLDIVLVGRLVRRHIAAFDPKRSEFDSVSAEQLESVDAEDITRGRRAIPDWAEPNLLWRLSGELFTQKSNLVLPREWIDTPVPWQSISDHWNTLARKLAHPTDVTPNREVKAPAATLSNRETQPPTNPVSAGALTSLDDTGCISAGASTFRFNDSKVLIAEILSHNDPAFMNMVKRQLALCRVEARALSLASVTVVPEDDANREEICGKGGHGIRPWQRKLVDRLADHPDVVNPYAFITADGELLLCLQDVERNETTILLRTDLEYVLAGAPDADGPLSQVKSLARYYSGIASTCAPNAGMTVEQLVEATCRCMSAASRQHKSSIKSIDVY